MNRRGFMQTLFGGVIVALLPWKPKDITQSKKIELREVTNWKIDTTTSSSVELPKDFHAKVTAYTEEMSRMGDACFKVHFFYGIPVNKNMPICYTITNADD